ncbi:MAG: glycosyltransferase [Sandaracinaceae bacterium]|nr:glycosyltransferase [Sandaracinaceae bacterium]
MNERVGGEGRRPGQPKVLVFGRSHRDTAERNACDALASMGCSVTRCDPDEGPSWLQRLRWHPTYGRFVRRALAIPGAGTLVERRLVAQAGAERPELVLVLSINDVSPATVQALRDLGIAVAGWFQDHVANFGAHRFMLAPYTGLFFKDPFIVDKMRGTAGMKHVHYLPEACEPSRHRPATPTDDDRRRFGCDVLVYGNLYPYRMHVLEPLLGMDVRLFGPRPAMENPHPTQAWWQGFDLAFEEKARALACARVVVSTSHFAEVQSANARIFETAGIGAFQISDAPGLKEFFVPGVEIATFEGAHDLRARVEHYLARPEERDAIARAGQVRAHADHTYARRLSRLFELCEIEAPSR